MANCNICKVELNNPHIIGSTDCGGDCELCMAEAGDPECAASVLKRVRKERERLPYQATAGWFRNLGAEQAEQYSPLLYALWQESQSNWERAHEIAQDIESPEAAWVHAYLHRREGDEGNAAYWYRRAQRPICKSTLDEEWHAITSALLANE